MPEPYEPDYQKWKAVFEQFKVNEDTMLVGHSCGGGFLIRWLSENKNLKVGKVALVAPWLDPDKTLTTDMFDFELDTIFVERTQGTTVFISKERWPDVQATVDRLGKEVVGINIKFIPDKGHFTMGDMKTEEFPELRDFLLG
jgi:predicted alpha/beta hydrolase family esterase